MRRTANQNCCIHTTTESHQQPQPGRTEHPGAHPAAALDSHMTDTATLDLRNVRHHGCDLVTEIGRLMHAGLDMHMLGEYLDMVGDDDDLRDVMSIEAFLVSSIDINEEDPDLTPGTRGWISECRAALDRMNTIDWPTLG